MITGMEIAQCYAALQDPKVWRATVFVSPKLTVKVTRRRHRGTRNLRDFVLTVGSPNYLERQFLKACKAAGEPLPVRRVQLKFLPKRKK